MTCYLSSPRGGREPMNQPEDPSIRYIQITRGKYVIVDAADYEWLMQWKWSVRKSGKYLFYAVRNINLADRKQETILMHRQILGLKKGDKRMVDHINHDTFDNRRSNLRIVTSSQNCANRRTRIDSFSGAKGLSWNPLSRRWDIQITKEGIVYRPGSRKNLDDALNIYIKTNLELNGEFACMPTVEEVKHAREKRLQDQTREDNMNILLRNKGKAILHANGLWTISKVPESVLLEFSKACCSD